MNNVNPAISRVFCYIKHLYMKLFTVIVAVILGFMLGVSCNYTPSKLGIIRALGNVDYQLYLTMDSAYVYDHNRYIGSCAHGNDGIDSVIRADNQ